MHLAPTPDLTWTDIDDALTRLAHDKGALDVEIGRWLLLAHRERIERKAGFGSFVEYVERRLGYDARTTHERLRVARALEELPRLAALLRTGQRSWSAVRELTRVVTPETEPAWVDATEHLTVRQVEAMVAGRAPGSRPLDPPDPLLRTHRLVFELSPDELAEWREAAEHVRRELGPAASHREVLRALVQRELGPRPDAQPAYQAAVTLCLGCERTWQRAGGELVEVAPEVGECARCDCEVVGVVDAEASARADVVPCAHVARGVTVAMLLRPPTGSRRSLRRATWSTRPHAPPPPALRRPTWAPHPTTPMRTRSPPTCAASSRAAAAASSPASSPTSSARRRP